MAARHVTTSIDEYLKRKKVRIEYYYVYICVLIHAIPLVCSIYSIGINTNNISPHRVATILYEKQNRDFFVGWYHSIAG